MGASDDDASPTQETEPLAKTRARRSNAGARMHEMMFNAEDDEALAQAYGIIKADDESSDDEEYVPKELVHHNDNADDADGNNDEDDDDDDDDDESSSESSSDGESEDEDEEEEEGKDDVEDEAQEEDNDHDEEDDIKGESRMDNVIGNHNNKSTTGRESHRMKARPKDIKPSRIKTENGTTSSTMQPGSPSKLAYDACSRICSVCLSNHSDEDDEIIECDSCGVTVHESCYGVSEEDGTADVQQHDDTSVHSMISSESTEPWFCEPCKRSVRNPHCELCPNLGGIFKETDTGRWVHMVCALYTRGVTFDNIANLTEVSLFELNYALYGSKACTICEDRRLARSGICIGCDAGLCKTFFHPTCAQREGLLFESPTDEVDPYFAQCKQHADKSIIKKKKKTCMALFARLKRVQNSENQSDRIKRKLSEITKQLDPCLTSWTPENCPPIPHKVSRMLLTSPSLIIKLTKKSELLGLDPNSAFMTIQDEMEMARQKWHIPPAFNLEFVAYCRDRATRMATMNKKNFEIMSQNSVLKKDESNLRQRYNSYKELVSQVRSENDQIIQKIRNIQESITNSTGKPFNLPQQLETLIEKCKTTKPKSPSKSSRSASRTSTTYRCGKCETVKDQHLLSLCDTCNCYFHIYCLDPPLSRVPKKTKFGGWQCSDCSERDEEEQEEAIEGRNTAAIQEANKPRRLRERVNAPEKYCHESMQMADFWSLSKRTKKSTSKSSKMKKPKLEVRSQD